MDAEQLVHPAVHAALLAAPVDIEAPPRLPAQPPGLHQRPHPVARLQPVPVGRRHDLGDLFGDVEPHLVEQRDRPDRETEPHRHLVDLLDRRTFRQQMPDLAGVGREDAVHPEAWAVLHDNHGLPHAAPERDGGAHGTRGRAGRRDYFEQRHLRDGREEVHADDAFRPARHFRDARDRDGGGVGGEDSRVRRRRLHFLQDLLLDRQVLEHRFDHELGSAESSVAVAAR